MYSTLCTLKNITEKSDKDVFINVIGSYSVT